MANGTVSDILQEVVEFVVHHELNFYERLNCEFVSGTTFASDEARGEFMNKVLKAGVLPYTESDYEEFREVADFLNTYHQFIGKEVIYENKKKKTWKQMLKRFLSGANK